ncbi:sugar phosphate isomerase/epimerase family protein [Rubritalea tangerina]|uniref:Sugar phosphate isomerase/epimerase family protein n=2 Tax=Rubritalea tangerina TaxID=430798 RepID=A0ABW4Z6W2_9BACT
MKRYQLSGFADEAGRSIETQINALKALGWCQLSARGIDGTNIHDLSEDDFERVASAVEEAGIEVVEFGSLIGSWSKSIHSDFDLTLGEVERCIPRMQRLGTKIVRVMSYAQEPWGEEQYVAERVRRLSEVVSRFSDAGITVAHENCMNYGGFSSAHTLELVEKVEGMKLIFDTGNPVFQRDRSHSDPQPWQDAYAFYEAVRELVVHVHVKDCLNPVRDGVEPEYTFPGEGQGQVERIMKDLLGRGYSGSIAIEPHVATVFHAQESEVDWRQCYESFVHYGRAFESLLGDCVK